jgi:N-acetylmuramoyl-L-alanine amidase
MNDPRFKGCKSISEYRVGNIYKYAVDGSDSYNETNASCRKLQDRFPGAFVIAVRDGNIIPVDQALKEINTTTKNN